MRPACSLEAILSKRFCFTAFKSYGLFCQVLMRVGFAIFGDHRFPGQSGGVLIEGRCAGLTIAAIGLLIGDTPM